MLQRVMIDGIKLPRLYIAENKFDAELAMSKGIPFIRWTQGQDMLIKILLRPVLERMFPDIMWTKVLGRKRRFRTQVTITESVEPEPHDQTELGIRLDEDGEVIERNEGDEVDGMPMADVHEDEDEDMLVESSVASSDERLFYGGGGDMVITHNLDIEDYVGDLSSCVNIEVLQRLRLMPAFIGDILDCIKINIGSGLHWREGYNKRLGIPVGRFNASGQLPNLIILDVSGSIPRGISATMIALIDTLRTQLSADLIITSTHSRFYPMGSELPDPQRIRDMFGYGNEAKDFFGILSNDIRGRHYGHVFSFGDNDSPDYYTSRKPSLEGTIVEHVHHYHTNTTWYRGDDFKTGYAKWCHMLSKQPLVEYDTSWCKVIKD
jgi:hypothetical protein